VRGVLFDELPSLSDELKGLENNYGPFLADFKVFD